MVSSQAKKDRWVIPKGGVEIDEAMTGTGDDAEEVDYRESALRETWEEAGATGTLGRYLGPPITGECPAEFWDGPEVYIEEDNRTNETASGATAGAPLHGGNVNAGGNPIKKKKVKRQTVFHFYEMLVESLADEWPESKHRLRKWATYEEARMELLRHDRKELAEALEKSSLKRGLPSDLS